MLISFYAAADYLGLLSGVRLILCPSRLQSTYVSFDISSIPAYLSILRDTGIRQYRVM